MTRFRGYLTTCTLRMDVHCEGTGSLVFADPVTGRDLNDTGFRLSGLESIPDLVSGPITAECGPGLEETNCVNFLNFHSKPSTRPFVTIDSGGTATIEWTRLTDMDPQLGSVAIIRLNFVPEPDTAALMGLGLVGLGVVGRKQRNSADGTA